MPEMLECTRSHAGRRSARTIVVWIVAIRNRGLRGLNRAHAGRHRVGRLDLDILDPWLRVRVVPAALRPAALAEGAPGAAGVHLVERDSHGGGASGGECGGFAHCRTLRKNAGRSELTRFRQHARGLLRPVAARPHAPAPAAQHSTASAERGDLESSGQLSFASCIQPDGQTSRQWRYAAKPTTGAPVRGMICPPNTSKRVAMKCGALWTVIAMVRATAPLH